VTKVEAEVNPHSELYSMVLSYGFLNSLSTGYLLFDADGEIIDCNKAAVNLLGTERDQLMGRTWYESKSGAVHEDGSPFPSDEQPTMVTFRSGEPVADVMIGVNNPKAARRWLLVSTYPLISNGQVKGVISSFIDLSDRIRREHARQLLLEVNRFVMFSPDGKEPLQNLCEALVRYGPYAVAGVAVASSNHKSGYELIRGAAQTEQLHEVMTSSSGLTVSGLGAIGTALRTRVTQVVNDLNDHPAPKPGSTVGMRS
jgi:PAS domain S-box-containing protein